MFAVDMALEGVEVRTLDQMNGDRHFSEVFISGVRVPDTDRIGDLGSGWAIAIRTLALERASLGGRSFGGDDAPKEVLPSWLQDWRATCPTRFAVRKPCALTSSTGSTS